MKNDNTYVVLSLTFLAAFYLFFFNFVFIDVNKSRAAIANPKITPAVDNIVLVVIDALRFDAIFNPDNSRFLKTEQIMNNKSAICFKTSLNSPSVNVPRIKALTSGSLVPFSEMFSDIQQDFEPNFISQFHGHRWNVSFYGDETWIKLYPTAFNKSHGINSLNIYDYSGVDHVIHEKLGYVLDNMSDKKNLLIVNYLGVDHIGHIYGPENMLMRKKYEEMDRTIAGIYSKLAKKKRSLLIVTGNHGMSEGGGHGGATPSELTTSTIFLSKMLSVDPRNCHRDRLEANYQQDLSTTLSLLTGMSIPEVSIGLPSLQLLTSFYKSATDVKEITLLLLSHFESLLECSSSSNVTCTQSLVVLKEEAENLSLMRQSLEKIKCDKSDAQCETKLRAKSLEIFSILVNIQKRLFHQVYTPNSTIILLLCAIVMSLVMLKISYKFLTYLKKVRNEQVLITYKDQWSSRGSFRALLVIFVFLIVTHSLCLNGNSFVEMEHEIWFYFSPTIFFLSAIPVILWHLNHQTSTSLIVYDLMPVIGLVSIDRFLRHLYSSGLVLKHSESMINDVDANGSFHYFLLRNATCVLFTVIRIFSLNRIQTRPKVNIFNREWNLQKSIIISKLIHWTPILTLGLVLYSKKSYFFLKSDEVINLSLEEKVYIERWSLLMFLVDLIFGIYHKASLTITKPRYLAFELLKGDRSVVRVLTSQAPSIVCQSFSLFMYLLWSDGIGLLWGLVLVKDMLLDEHFGILSTRMPQSENKVFKMTTFMIYWSQAWVTFFHHGNSNSISTINFSVGSFGQKSFDGILPMLLVGIFTYSGILYWISIYFLKILPKISRIQKQIEDDGLQKSFILGTIILPVNLFSITCFILRFNSYIWSVFVPKLVYTAFYITFVLPFYAVNFYLSRY